MGISVEELAEETLAQYWMRLQPNERTNEQIIKISLEMLLALLEVHESTNQK